MLQHRLAFFIAINVFGISRDSVSFLRRIFKMVKVAIVGGTGGLAREVTDTLLATKKHEILLLSRKVIRRVMLSKRSQLIYQQEIPDTPQPPLTTWVKVDYSSIDNLANALKDTHTLLSFITPQTDKNNIVQRYLIDAAVKAGVKRFAPSEWVGSGLQHMDWYWGKQGIRDYLAEINRDRKVLEYSLFQPGWFTDYFAYPTQSAKYFRSFPVCISFENCRAFYAEGSENSRVTLTTVSDFAEIVAQAVGLEGTWPEVGGIKGSEMTVKALLEVGERVRGQKFTIETLKRGDLEQNKVLCSWIPKVDHPAVGDYENLAEKLNASVLLSIADEDMNVGDEWARLLPAYAFGLPEQDLEWQVREAGSGKARIHRDDELSLHAHAHIRICSFSFHPFQSASLK
ncbi:hypothetical protein AC579_9247 [Pseudocercospora musae]|uniref:NmrA-like domain-containing protein n=1 Tax=Pseudocercospora musae TaxID=113226 RepID=A0A139IHU0_9PEZI|nr:hypothetical protein AC579_9247 [Pseudocercospora musae]